MVDTPKDQEEYSEEETARRRDATLKHMLDTPPKPHKPNDKHKPKPTAKKTKR